MSNQQYPIEDISPLALEASPPSNPEGPAGADPHQSMIDQDFALFSFVHLPIIELPPALDEEQSPVMPSQSPGVAPPRRMGLVREQPVSPPLGAWYFGNGNSQQIGANRAEVDDTSILSESNEHSDAEMAEEAEEAVPQVARQSRFARDPARMDDS
jgi:hypothetical protein